MQISTRRVHSMQGLSQDLETGCSKLANLEFLGHQGKPKYT